MFRFGNLNDLERKKCPALLAFSCLLLALCSVLCLPDTLVAQQDVPPVTHFDVITEDEQGGKIRFPSFVFSDPVNNEIYVITQTEIIVYTSDFFPVITLGRKDGIEAPWGLTVDVEGNLYVAHSAPKENPRHKITVFNACFKWVRDIYLKGFEGADSFLPYRLSTDKKGNIYVAGSSFPGILLLNNQGDFLEFLSPEESGNKVKLDNVTVDKEGRVYLVSEEEGHIYVYDENRKFLFKFGQKGGSRGKLSRARGIGVDNRNGRMYVVDYMRHTVLAYDRDGNYLFEFGGLGWGEGWFQYPRDITVDSQGRILVADTFNERIEVFKPNE